MTDRLWKVTVSCLFPQGKPVEKVLEVRHPDEEGAREAALTQEAIEHGGSTIPTIVKVEQIG